MTTISPPLPQPASLSFAPRTSTSSSSSTRNARLSRLLTSERILISAAKTRRPVKGARCILALVRQRRDARSSERDIIPFARYLDQPRAFLQRSIVRDVLRFGNRRAKTDAKRGIDGSFVRSFANRNRRERRWTNARLELARLDLISRARFSLRGTFNSRNISKSRDHRFD